MDKDEYYMQKALQQAKKAYIKNEIPIGAIIVKEDKIIAKSYNKKESKNSSLYHAEMDAIYKANKKLGWRLNECTIYTTVEPCPMCMSAIILSRIDRLVYGASDKKTGASDSKIKMQDYDLYHKVEVKSGVLQKEAKDLMESFFKKLREEKKGNG